jgi:hypothetical protein
MFKSSWLPLSVFRVVHEEILSEDEGSKLFQNVHTYTEIIMSYIRKQESSSDTDTALRYKHI